MPVLRQPRKRQTAVVAWAAAAMALLLPACSPAPINTPAVVPIWPAPFQTPTSMG